MEEFLIGIISSLVADGFSTLIRFGVKKIRKFVKSKEKIQGALKIDQILKSSISELASKLAATKLFTNEFKNTMLKLFLESPTTESLVRQIYSDFLFEEGELKSINQLKTEFRMNLAYHLGSTTKNIKNISDQIFDVLQIGCKSALDFAINQNILSAHESKSIARHRIIIDELKALNENLEFLESNPKLNIKNIKKFEKE